MNFQHSQRNDRFRLGKIRSIGSTRKTWFCSRHSGPDRSMSKTLYLALARQVLSSNRSRCRMRRLPLSTFQSSREYKEARARVSKNRDRTSCNSRPSPCCNDRANTRSMFDYQFRRESQVRNGTRIHSHPPQIRIPLGKLCTHYPRRICPQGSSRTKLIRSH